MTIPKFLIKGIDTKGREVIVSQRQFTSIYRAELASLDFYGDRRFRQVWVERSGVDKQAA